MTQIVMRIPRRNVHNDHDRDPPSLPSLVFHILGEFGQAINVAARRLPRPPRYRWGTGLAPADVPPREVESGA